MTCSWLQSTGSGDDVLEVTSEGIVITATAARVRQLAEMGELGEWFGRNAGDVEASLRLYRLAHEPALARASEDAVRETLAARRAQDARLAEVELPHGRIDLDAQEFRA